MSYRGKSRDWTYGIGIAERDIGMLALEIQGLADALVDGSVRLALPGYRGYDSGLAFGESS